MTYFLTITLDILLGIEAIPNLTYGFGVIKSLRTSLCSMLNVDTSSSVTLSGHILKPPHCIVFVAPSNTNEAVPVVGASTKFSKLACNVFSLFSSEMNEGTLNLLLPTST